MRRLIVFNQVSLDGYFVDAHGDMRWAHNAANDAEWQAFVEGNASGAGVLYPSGIRFRRVVQVFIGR